MSLPVTFILYELSIEYKYYSEDYIDIGVLLAEVTSENPLHIDAGISRELWMMLRLRLELDLVILNRASSLMKRNAAKTGVPLYVISPEQWRAFRLRAFREFEDDRRFRNRRWEQVKRRILNVLIPEGLKTAPRLLSDCRLLCRKLM